MSQNFEKHRKPSHQKLEILKNAENLVVFWHFGCILYLLLGILQVFCINFILFEIKNIPQPGADLTPQALLASRDAVFVDYFPDHSQVFKSLCNEDIRRDGQAAL